MLHALWAHNAVEEIHYQFLFQGFGQIPLFQLKFTNVKMKLAAQEVSNAVQRTMVLQFMREDCAVVVPQAFSPPWGNA